jgi:hypothetical protein
MSEPSAERGLLNLSVELSNNDITAGSEFTLYVKVTNPFSKPVWVERVHVNLPSELNLALDKERTLELTRREAQRKREIDENAKAYTRVGEALSQVDGQLRKLAVRHRSSDERVTNTLTDVRISLNKVENILQTSVSRGPTLDIRESIIDRAAFSAASTLDARGAKIRSLEIYGPTETQGAGREIRLQSSLPSGASLQPGSTDVFKAVLKTNRNIFFTPSKYRLQFNANYSFDEIDRFAATEPQGSNVEQTLFTNTTSVDISIRASVWSIISGAAVGGIVGSLGRFIQSHPNFEFDKLTNAFIGGALSIMLATILSVVAVVFVARKSDSQSFVSVEDVWGGLLIGFFVGYTGTSFFTELTKLQAPISTTTPSTPASPQ